MNPEITKEQTAQLTAWAEQRDEILSQISSLRVEEERLGKKNKELASSNADIIINMNQVKGRIQELQTKEAELPELIRKDVAVLLAQKTSLETEITILQKMVKALTPQKESLENSISFLTDTFDSLHERVGVLDRVVGHLTEISSKNDKSIADLVDEIKKGLGEVVKKNQEAIKEMGIVTAEMPKVFLEVQKKSLIRQVINPKKI